MTVLVSGAPLGPEGPGLALFPAVIVLAFLFETMDPASGMLWAGAFPAGVVAPYAVRVLPSRIWRYVIPAYAIRHRRSVARPAVRRLTAWC